MKNQRMSTRTLTGLAILTAVVVVLQLLGSFIHFGPFSISLVLMLEKEDNARRLIEAISAANPAAVVEEYVEPNAE